MSEIKIRTAICTWCWGEKPITDFDTYDSNYPKVRICRNCRGDIIARPPQLRRKKPIPEDVCWLYVIESYDLFKIGSTCHVDNRLKDLGNSIPGGHFELILLFPTKDWAACEATLHLLFESKRINGEWFSLEDEDINLLYDITKGMYSDG